GLRRELCQILQSDELAPRESQSTRMIHISEGVTLMSHFPLKNEYAGSTIPLASSSVFGVLPLGSLFVCGCGSIRPVGRVGRASCGMGNFRQIHSVYGQTQLVFTESGGSVPSCCRHLRRDSSWYSAGRRMANAENGSLKWRFASAICSH